MQKTVQKQLAKDLRLNIAEGGIVPAKNQQYTIPEGVNYPCFAKPLIPLD